MPRRRKVLLLLLAIGLSAYGLFVFLTGEKEPSYEGRTLSEWTAMYSIARLGKSFGPPEPGDAIRHIGTNALPRLLKWMDFEPGWRHQVARAARKKLPAWMGNGVVVVLLIGDHKANQAYRARDAFGALGPMAAPAIPQLARMASLTNSPFKADAAFAALAYIGPDAQPTIERLLSSPAYVHGEWPGAVIEITGLNARPLVLLMLERLQSTNSVVARQSVWLLRCRQTDPALVIPALITNLQSARLEDRKLAPLVLDVFGEQARPALPALSNALRDPNPSVRENASNAIFRITRVKATRATSR